MFLHFLSTWKKIPGWILYHSAPDVSVWSIGQSDKPAGECVSVQEMLFNNSGWM